ncbi:MAG: hypothetical protein NTY19_08250 [Planctomycetota bacterium]|nr:hypothetical protein [Planctomycetota bacterium]
MPAKLEIAADMSSLENAYSKVLRQVVSLQDQLGKLSSENMQFERTAGGSVKAAMRLGDEGRAAADQYTKAMRAANDEMKAGTASKEEHRKKIEQAKAALEVETMAIKSQQAETQKLKEFSKQVIEAQQTGADKARATFDQLTEARRRGLLTEEQYARAVKETSKQADAAQRKESENHNVASSIASEGATKVTALAMQWVTVEGILNKVAEAYQRVGNNQVKAMEAQLAQASPDAQVLKNLVGMSSEDKTKIIGDLDAMSKELGVESAHLKRGFAEAYSKAGGDVSLALDATRRAAELNRVTPEQIPVAVAAGASLSKLLGTKDPRVALGFASEVQSRSAETSQERIMGVLPGTLSSVAATVPKQAKADAAREGGALLAALNTAAPRSFDSAATAEIQFSQQLAKFFKPVPLSEEDKRLTEGKKARTLQRIAKLKSGGGDVSDEEEEELEQLPQQEKELKRQVDRTKSPAAKRRMRDQLKEMESRYKELKKKSTLSDDLVKDRIGGMESQVAIYDREIRGEGFLDDPETLKGRIKALNKSPDAQAKFLSTVHGEAEFVEQMKSLVRGDESAIVVQKFREYTEGQNAMRISPELFEQQSRELSDEHGLTPSIKLAAKSQRDKSELDATQVKKVAFAEKGRIKKDADETLEAGADTFMESFDQTIASPGTIIEGLFVGKAQAKINALARAAHGIRVIAGARKGTPMQWNGIAREYTPAGDEDLTDDERDKAGAFEGKAAALQRDLDMVNRPSDARLPVAGSARPWRPSKTDAVKTAPSAKPDTTAAEKTARPAELDGTAAAKTARHPDEPGPMRPLAATASGSIEPGIIGTTATSPTRPVADSDESFFLGTNSSPMKKSSDTPSRRAADWLSAGPARGSSGDSGEATAVMREVASELRNIRRNQEKGLDARNTQPNVGTSAAAGQLLGAQRQTR